MAVPKKKVTRSRRNMRRFSSFNRLGKPTIIRCAQCSEPTRPHSVCVCGYYAGKKVTEPRVRTNEVASQNA
jgi:large subunit ribosomal protein L32